MADTRARKKIGKGRHASALKRQRQNEKLRLRNRATRSCLRTAIKAFREKPTPETLALTIPLIDKAASRGIIPRKRASRLASRLSLLTHRSASGKATTPTAR